MVKKEESVIVVVQDSKKGHLIINKLSDITITACSYFDSSVMHSSSLMTAKNSRRLQNEQIVEDSVLKLVRPGEEHEVGLFNWNHPEIELEFYYDSKNIEFKQRFILNFEQIGPDYSVRHVLH